MFEGLQAALKQLTDERTRLDSAITSLEGLLGTGSAKVARVKRGRKARGPVLLGAVSPPSGKSAKRAPRGLLKAKIHQALKESKTPLAPVVLRDRVLRLGYPSKNLKSLYISVYVTAKGDKAILKTAKGFSLK